ncbi:MAG: hypothetical protein ACXIUD_02040 [Mongoliitalea sp.]
MMITNFKTSYLLALILFITCSFTAQAQFIERLGPVEGFTKPEEITILHDYSETKDLIKIGEAHSKARGAWVFTAINAIDTRARKKLLEEASSRGASHVWITQRMPYGGLEKFYSYQAVLYLAPEKKISEQQVRNILSNSTFSHQQTARTNRNAYGIRLKSINKENVITIHEGSDIFSTDEGVFVNIQTPKRDKVLTFTYQIIGIQENLIFLSEVVKPNKVYAVHQLYKR